MVFPSRNRNLGALVAEVGLDTSRLNRDTSRAQGQFQSLEKTVKATAATLGVAFGGAFVIGQVQSAISAASDLNESINAVNVVFGQASNTITTFGETASRTTGLAAADFNQLSTQTGSFLQNFGLSAEDAADQTILLAQRAADMASVFNTDVKDALFAINAALRGETEPIRRYAADVTEASLKSFALANNIEKSVEQMTQQEKGLLRLQVVLAQTARVQGDFVNTSDELANRQRILRAEFTNLRAELGQRLLPVVNQATLAMLTLLRAFQDGFELPTLRGRRRTDILGLFGIGEGGIIAQMQRIGEEAENAADTSIEAFRRIDRELALPRIRPIRFNVGDEIEEQVEKALVSIGQLNDEVFDLTQDAFVPVTKATEEWTGSIQKALDTVAMFNEEVFDITVDAFIPATKSLRELREESGLFENLLAFDLPMAAEQFTEGLINEEEAFRLLESAITATNVQLGKFAAFEPPQVRTQGLTQAFGGVPSFPTGRGIPALGNTANLVNIVSQDEIDRRRREGQETDRQISRGRRDVLIVDANGQSRQQAQVIREADL